MDLLSRGEKNGEGTKFSLDDLFGPELKFVPSSGKFELHELDAQRTTKIPKFWCGRVAGLVYHLN